MRCRCQICFHGGRLCFCTTGKLRRQESHFTSSLESCHSSQNQNLKSTFNQRQPLWRLPWMAALLKCVLSTAGWPCTDGGRFDLKRVSGLCPPSLSIQLPEWLAMEVCFNELSRRYLQALVRSGSSAQLNLCFRWSPSQPHHRPLKGRWAIGRGLMNWGILKKLKN